MKHYSYQLNSLSKIILSPRSQEAYYLDLGDFTETDLNEHSEGSKIKIIYPFYQYGMYEGYHPTTTSYYIPGSSVKGLLTNDKGVDVKNIKIGKPELMARRASSDLLVDDVSVPAGDIVLNEIFKFQSLEKEQKDAKLKPFFKNVAVEMCRQDIELKGQLFTNADIKASLNYTSAVTVCLVRQLIVRLQGICKDKIGDISEMEEVLTALTALDIDSYKNDANRYLGILGGYKGQLLSYLVKNDKGMPEAQAEQQVQGIYIDKETMLPYGLVEFSNVVEIDAQS